MEVIDMIIYKISNNQNDKLYIGQTSGTAEKRFARHINDAMNNILDTHFARAIRKYGPENFRIEVIDTATTQEELNYKEHYWANYYDSIKNGYNEVDPIYRSGGNTYQSKTPEELQAISNKIRASKLGGLNPQAKKIKCKNINTDEELHFNSLSEAQEYFGESNHNFITRRCRGEIKCLFRKEWMFAYEDENYANDTTVEIKHGRAIPVKVIDLSINEERTFTSFSEAERYFQLANRALRGCAAASRGEKDYVFKKRYHVIVLE